MKKYFFIPIIIGLVLALPASAAIIRGGDEFSLESDSVLDQNAYIFAGSSVISGDVDGDLTLFSGNVTITGFIAEDLNVLGGTVTVLGDVGGDVRAAGGNVIIGGFVGGELMAFAGSLDVLSGAEIDGDLLVAGGKVEINGLINGRIGARSGEVSLNGQVLGGVTVRSVKNLLIGDDLVVGGDFSYSANQEMVIPENVLISGDISFEQIEPRQKPDIFDLTNTFQFLFGILWVFALLKLLVLIVTALAAVYVARNVSKAIVKQSLGNFWKEFLRGFIVAIIVPIVAFILVLTMVGSVIGIVIGLTYILLTTIGYIFAGIIFGSWLFKIFSKKKEMRVDWLTTLTGIVTLYLIATIPILGWAVAFLFILSSFGAVVYLFYKNLWKKR